MKFVGILAIVLLLSACANAPESGVIVVGAPLSLTGFASAYGQNTMNGLEMAKEEINANGGIHGRMIEIIYEDDATNGKNAATVAQKLIAIDGVDALIGGTWDLSVEPIAPIADREDILFITPSTGNTEENNRLSENLFRTWPAIHYQMAGLGEALTHENVSTIVVLRNTGPWSLAHKDGLERLMRERGGQVVADFAQINVDGNDFRTDISKVKMLNPDAVFIAVGYNDATNILKILKEQSVDVKVFSSDGALGTALDMGALSLIDAEGAYIIDLAPADEVFRQKYMERYGGYPGVSADHAYVALQLLAECYARTETTNTAVNRECLSKKPVFDANGDAIGPAPVYRVEGGSYVRRFG